MAAASRWKVEHSEHVYCRERPQPFATILDNTVIRRGFIKVEKNRHSSLFR
jgi:hypothetical protein